MYYSSKDLKNEYYLNIISFFNLKYRKYILENIENVYYITYMLETSITLITCYLI